MRLRGEGGELCSVVLFAVSDLESEVAASLRRQTQNKLMVYRRVSFNQLEQVVKYSRHQHIIVMLPIDALETFALPPPPRLRQTTLPTRYPMYHIVPFLHQTQLLTVIMFRQTQH